MWCHRISGIAIGRDPVLSTGKAPKYSAWKSSTLYSYKESEQRPWPGCQYLERDQCVRWQGIDGCIDRHGRGGQPPSPRGRRKKYGGTASMVFFTEYYFVGRSILSANEGTVQRGRGTLSPGPCTGRGIWKYCLESTWQMRRE